MDNKPTRGGKRPGAGRPAAEPSAVLNVRLPVRLLEQVKARGGSRWVREIVEQALKNV